MKNSTHSSNLADLVEGLQTENLTPGFESLIANPETELTNGKSQTLGKDSSQENSMESLDSFLSDCLDSELICKKVTYIDPLIHEVLLMIKQKRGVPVGILLGFLAQEFIAKNKSEIKKMYAQNNLLK